MSKIRGFTLVELLVVISILAILTVVGAALYSGVSKSSRDSKRKADIQAIAKAYETNYQNGGYQTLTTANFASGAIPQDPAGGSYYTNISSDNSAFRVCTALESNPQRTCSSPSTNCYCLTSTQGSYTSGSGGSIDHPSSCDPNGTLGYQLLGYWALNDGAGTTAINSSAQGSVLNMTLSGATWLDPGRFSKALYFNGADTRVYSNSNILLPNGDFSISAWIKVSTTATNNTITIRGNTYNVVPWAWFIYNGSTNRLNLWNANGNTASYSNVISIEDNLWHHIAVSANVGSYPQFYFDGGNITPSSGNNTYANTTYNVTSYPFEVGARTHTSGIMDELIGSIDDLRFYNRAISGSEITALAGGCIPS